MGCEKIKIMETKFNIGAKVFYLSKTSIENSLVTGINVFSGEMFVNDFGNYVSSTYTETYYLANGNEVDACDLFESASELIEYLEKVIVKLKN